MHRKLIRGGQRSVSARLELGASSAVLGVPAPMLVGRIASLEQLWGRAATERLAERLASARQLTEAAAILEGAIAERFAMGSTRHATRAQLALAAAERLTRANVNAVAFDLGVSERHLRRVFRDVVGVSPKVFSRLRRFRVALRAARVDAQASWASIAASAGYYDQAHLIAEFRAIAGVTPPALLSELRVAPAIG